MLEALAHGRALDVELKSVEIAVAILGRCAFRQQFELIHFGEEMRLGRFRQSEMVALYDQRVGRHFQRAGEFPKQFALGVVSIFFRFRGEGESDRVIGFACALGIRGDALQEGVLFLATMVVDLFINTT